jgi:hypothetical protein
MDDLGKMWQNMDDGMSESINQALENADAEREARCQKTRDEGLKEKPDREAA